MTGSGLSIRQLELADMKPDAPLETRLSATRRPDRDGFLDDQRAVAFGPQRDVVAHDLQPLDAIAPAGRPEENEENDENAEESQRRSDRHHHFVTASPIFSRTPSRRRGTRR